MIWLPRFVRRSRARQEETDGLIVKVAEAGARVSVAGEQLRHRTQVLGSVVADRFVADAEQEISHVARHRR